MRVTPDAENIGEPNVRLARFGRCQSGGRGGPFRVALSRSWYASIPSITPRCSEPRHRQDRRRKRRQYEWRPEEIHQLQSGYCRHLPGLTRPADSGLRRWYRPRCPREAHSRKTNMRAVCRLRVRPTRPFAASLIATSFAFPTWWHYDVLRGLGYLRAAGVAPDERMADAIELLALKSDGKGRWLLETPYPGSDCRCNGSRDRSSQPLEHVAGVKSAEVVFGCDLDARGVCGPSIASDQQLREFTNPQARNINLLSSMRRAVPDLRSARNDR